MSGVTILGRDRPTHRRRVLRDAGDADVRLVVQLRTLAHAQPGRGRRPRAGDVPQGTQGLRFIPAGDEFSRLDVPHSAEYVPDVAQRLECEDDRAART